MKKRPITVTAITAVTNDLSINLFNFSQHFFVSLLLPEDNNLELDCRNGPSLKSRELRKREFQCTSNLQ